MRVPILDATGLVVNVIVMGDGWAPPEGFTIGALGGEIGDTWNGASYIKRLPEPSPTPPADDYATAIQSHVDTIARTRGYGDGYGLASYIASTIPAWASEAQTFVAWRDAVWVHAYTELAKVQGGQRSQPTISEMIAELPSIQWPGG